MRKHIWDMFWRQRPQDLPVGCRGWANREHEMVPGLCREQLKWREEQGGGGKSS